MKRIFFIISLVMMGFTFAFSQNTKKQSEITFEKKVINLGTFSEKQPVVYCEFVFKNTGNHPLIIHQAIASCGCTVPSYPKTPVMPGEKGVIKIKYNGKGKFPGKFKKSITIRSNARKSMVRLYITGNMLPKNLDKK